MLWVLPASIKEKNKMKTEYYYNGVFLYGRIKLEWTDYAIWFLIIAGIVLGYFCGWYS